MGNRRYTIIHSPPRVPGDELRANGLDRRDDGLAKRLDEAWDHFHEDGTWASYEPDCEETDRETAVALPTPTYPAGNAQNAEATRRLLAAAAHAFGDMAQAHYANGGSASVYAIKAATGLGKTTELAALIAHIRRHGPKDSPLAKKPWLFLVSTHRLGEEIVSKFASHGLRATVWRGREAWTDDSKTETMCQDLAPVKLAQALGEPVETAVCKGKDLAGNPAQCRLYDLCAYQRQKHAKPDVWIAAHNMLWHHQPALGDVCAIVIDESFWASGIRETASITLQELRSEPFNAKRISASADLAQHRSRLGRAVDLQKEPGGLRREHLEAVGLTAEACADANRREWDFKPPAALWPGMPPEARKQMAEAAKEARHTTKRSAAWKALRDFLNRPEGDVSGQVELSHADNGNGRHAVLHVRRLNKVVSPLSDKPTLILDATLPDLSLLKPFFPAVEVIAELEATMPHARIRYIPDAPTAAKKFAGADASSRNVRDLRRYIIKRWLEHGRQDTLVICQKGGEAKLKALGLPANIHVEHFNNVAGLDGYKDTRLLILAGRILPEPDKLEPLAGALTGVEPRPANVNPQTGGRWHDCVEHAIRMADGTGAPTRGDQHPDPTVEAIRWQTCEAELLQALGRVRGINRTAADPVQIDILTNVALPVAVHEVMSWKEGSADLGGWVETAVEGVVLTSPTDRLKLFPQTWGSLRKAEREPADFTATSLYKGSLKANGGEIPAASPFVWVRYRPRGRGQQCRMAWFDLAAIPDPSSWLVAKLGPMARVLVGDPPRQAAQSEPDRRPRMPKLPLLVEQWAIRAGRGMIERAKAAQWASGSQPTPSVTGDAVEALFGFPNEADEARDGQRTTPEPSATAQHVRRVIACDAVPATAVRFAAPCQHARGLWQRAIATLQRYGPEIGATSVEVTNLLIAETNRFVTGGSVPGIVR